MSDELARTQKPCRSKPAKVVLAALAVHARAAERRRKTVRVVIALTVVAILAAGAVFWANSIVAEIAEWQAERNASVVRIQSTGDRQ